MTGFSLSDGLDLVGVSVDEVWRVYAELGGTCGPEQLAGAMSSEAMLGEREHDLIAQALNECFLERGISTFPVGYLGTPEGVPPQSAFIGPITRGIVASRQIRFHAAQARRRAALVRQRSAELRTATVRTRDVHR